MSKADEMFEKLGYRKIYTQFKSIAYYKDDANIIYFVSKLESFFKSGVYERTSYSFTMQELQAINEKCKELGWNV